MLFVPRGANDFSITASYGGADFRPGTTTFGTSITPATTNAYSAYVPMGTLTRDAYAITVNLNGYNASANTRVGAVSIGVDYTGGTNYTEIVSGALMSFANFFGQAGTSLGGMGITYNFPIFIPSGSAVAMRARGNSATPAVSANILYAFGPPKPETVRKGSFVETLGVGLGAATCTGVNVTAGTTTDGSGATTWTLIGTTQKRTWHYNAAVQILGDTTLTSLVLFLDLAYGDGTNFTIIAQNIYVATSGREQFTIIPNFYGVECNVPPGSNIYARLHNSAANPDGTPTAGQYQVVVYATGG